MLGEKKYDQNINVLNNYACTVVDCHIIISTCHVSQDYFYMLLSDQKLTQTVLKLSPQKCHFDCAAPMGILSGSDIVSSVANRADNNGWRVYKVCWFSWGICPIVLWPLRNRLSIRQIGEWFTSPFILHHTPAVHQNEFY